MADFDVPNQSAIDGLNQRGGRMLSLVDLLEAGTLPLEAAALLAWGAARGLSLLTAAGPGGVGKTTLLGAFLAFLPPGTECVTVAGAGVLERLPAGRPLCLLVHEINDAAYFGYLWGPEIGRLVSLAGDGRAIAATLHATSYGELIRKLEGAPLGARPEHLGRVELIALMTAHRGMRRVSELRLADGAGGHRRILDHDAAADRFALAGESDLLPHLSRATGLPEASVAAGLGRARSLLAEARSRGVREMKALRALSRGAGFP